MTSVVARMYTEVCLTEITCDKLHPATQFSSKVIILFKSSVYVSIIQHGVRKWFVDKVHLRGLRRQSSFQQKYLLQESFSSLIRKQQKASEDLALQCLMATLVRTGIYSSKNTIYLQQPLTQTKMPGQWHLFFLIWPSRSVRLCKHQLYMRENKSEDGPLQRLNLERIRNA